MKNGTKVRAAGQVGVIVVPNGRSTFEYFTLNDSPNIPVYSVLFEDTGEIRRFRDTALTEVGSP
jgi:hypothetical protein